MYEKFQARRPLFPTRETRIVLLRLEQVPGLSNEMEGDGRSTNEGSKGREDREEKEEGSRSAGVLGT